MNDTRLEPAFLATTYRVVTPAGIFRRGPGESDSWISDISASMATEVAAD
jgi:hypothetical protein